MSRTLILAATLACTALPAWADQCRAFVNGEEVVVEAENFQTFSEEVKRRERLLSWPSRTWNRTWGAPVACDSGVLYDYLATTVPDDDITGYCLVSTEDNGYVLAPGERNFRGMCKTTLCEKVNTTKEQGKQVAATMAGVAAQNAREAGMSAIKHGTGAMIMTGSASSLTTSLGTAGTSVMTALSTPAVLGAAAVSVVAVGGAVYMCSGAEDDLPPAPLAEPVSDPVSEPIPDPETDPIVEPAPVQDAPAPVPAE
jgi:hypothetical protein